MFLCLAMKWYHIYDRKPRVSVAFPELAPKNVEHLFEVLILVDGNGVESHL